MNGGLWQDAGRRLRANFGAVMAMCLIAILILLAVVGPWFNPNDIEALDWSHVASVPSLASAHWFGTDRLGRDLFVRTLDGARVSLTVGLIASAVSLGVGLSYGAIAGYIGGRTDHLMMRIIEILARPAAHFFRHILDRDLRAERVPVVSVHRRRRLVDDGENRARPDLERPPPRVHRSGGGRRGGHGPDHLQAHRPQRHRPGDRLRNPHRASDHSVREFLELSWVSEFRSRTRAWGR